MRPVAASEAARSRWRIKRSGVRTERLKVLPNSANGSTASIRSIGDAMLGTLEKEKGSEWRGRGGRAGAEALLSEDRGGGAEQRTLLGRQPLVLVGPQLQKGRTGMGPQRAFARLQSNRIVAEKGGPSAYQGGGERRLARTLRARDEHRPAIQRIVSQQHSRCMQHLQTSQRRCQREGLGGEKGAPVRTFRSGSQSSSVPSGETRMRAKPGACTR